MHSRRSFGVLFSACLASLLLVGAHSGWAGSVETDEITVYSNATLWGTLNVGQTATAPTNGLLLYYSFATNTSPVPDDSGNGVSGTVHTATWTNAGIKDGAYSFAGGDDDDCITFSDSGLPSGNAARTISLWVKVESFVNEPANYAFSYGTIAEGQVFSLDLGSSSHNFRIVDYPDCGDTGYKPPIGVWQHIVVKHDGTTVSLYVNGSWVWSTDHEFGTVLSAGTLAAWAPPPNESPYPFNGLLDEVRVYNRALSLSEIQHLYLAPMAGTNNTSSVMFHKGIDYVYPLGDLSMGSYTNKP